MADKQFIPLIGSLTTRGLNINTNLATYDQRFQNCIFTITENPYTQKKTLFVSRRPGPATYQTFSNFSVVKRFYIWKNTSVGSVGVHYGTKAASSVQRVTATGSFSYDHSDAYEIVRFEDAYNSSGTASLLWTRSKPDAWIFPYGGAVAQITTVPSDMLGGFVYIDGYTFIAASSGKIYNSPINNPEGAYTDFISADMSADQLVDIIKFQNLLLAFGKDSCEVFQIVNNPTGSPLQRVQELFFKVGLKSRLSTDANNEAPFHIQATDSLYWVGQCQDNNLLSGVWSMDKSLKPTKISNPVIDKWLVNARGITYAQIAGQECIIVGNSTTAFVYQLETKHWHYWTSAGSLVFNSIFPGSNLIANNNGYNFCANGSNVVGIIDSTDSNYQSFQDFGSAITREIRTSVVDFDTNNYKRWDGFSIIGDKESSTSNISVSWTDDDYANYSTAQSVDMSLEDPTIRGLGTSRRRAWKMSDTLNSANRLRGVDLHYEILKA